MFRVPPPASHRQRSGMSMIEVMIALVVITVAMLTVFGAMGSAQQANEMARTRNRVMGEVEKVVERIQAAEVIYDSSARTPYVSSTSSAFDVEASTARDLTPWPGASKLVTVRPKPGTVGVPASLRPLVITVQYRDSHNVNLTTTYDYYYATRP